MRTKRNIKQIDDILKNILVVFILLECTTNTIASWAPLQNVQAGKTISGSTTTVWYKVFDPVLNEWKEGSHSYSGYSISFTNTDGVVAWLASKSGSYKVGYAVYDPAREKWIEGGSSYSSWSINDPYAGNMSQSYTVSQLKNTY